MDVHFRGCSTVQAPAARQEVLSPLTATAVWSEVRGSRVGAVLGAVPPAPPPSLCGGLHSHRAPSGLCGAAQ